MNIMTALVAGVLMGWGSSVRIGTDGREELIVNVVVGSVGAYLSGWILTAIYPVDDPGRLSFSAIVAAILGAATALIVVNKVREA